MYRLLVALLSGVLLIAAACAQSMPPLTPLTEGDLDKITANPAPGEESASEDQTIPFPKQSIINSENTRIPEQRLPPAPPLYPVGRSIYSR